MSNKSICSFPNYLCGPFKQVIYLGCSVKSFQMTMGWGGETSSCKIDLVRDYEPFPSNLNNPNISSNIGSRFENQNSNVFMPSHIANPNTDTDVLYSDIKQYPDIKKDNSYTGKRCYNVYSPGNSNSYLDMTLADPGFLCDSNNNEWSQYQQDFDIMGVPTIFQWENIYFGGIIQNWSKKDDYSYSVEINSFAKILKGVTFILKEYYGSISTYIGGYNVPFNWAFYPSTDFATRWPDRGAGSTQWGGYGNLFNVFGYLEAQGWGNSKYVKNKGIPANKVYDAIEDMVGYTTNSTIIQRRNSPFSPTPGVVTRQLFNKISNTITSPSFVTYNNISLNNMGLLNGNIFFVDFTNIPRPPDGVYINSDTIDLISFIDLCCDGAGLDYYIYFDGVIRITTISRKKISYRTDLKDYITNLQPNDYVKDYNLGEEYYHDSVNHIVVGGHQKRLIQVNSYSVGTPFYRIYNPDTNSFLDSTGSVERYRHPNFLNWAGYNDGAYTKIDHDKAIGAVSYSWSPHHFADMDGNFRKGSYQNQTASSVSFLNTNVISPYFGMDINGNVREVYWDYKTKQMILKLTFSDIESLLPGYNQNYDNAEAYIHSRFANQLGYSGDLTYGKGSFILSENELRAAGAGYDNWIAYARLRLAYGKPTEIFKIMYNLIAKTHGPATAIAFFYGDTANDAGKVDYMSYLQVASRIQGTWFGTHLRHRPITAEQYAANVSGIHNIMQKIHSFINQLVQNHYGKTFAVRIQNLQSSSDENGAKYNLQLTDSAWESEGNMIDDTITIGSVVSSRLRESDGRIGPLLGFNNTAQWIPRSGPPAFFSPSTPQKHLATFFYAYVLGYLGGTVYWPLSHTLSSQEYINIPYKTYGTHLYPNNNANYSNIYSYRLYTRSQIGSSFILDNNMPKVISTLGSPMYAVSNTDQSGILDEIYALLENNSTSTTAPSVISPVDTAYAMLPSTIAVNESRKAALRTAIWSLNRNGIMNVVGSSDKPFMLQKAATPIYAAVPIESQYYRYGPWINNPFLLNAIDIFEDPPDQTAVSTILNNLGGGTNATINDSLVPWEYGGELAMHEAAGVIAGSESRYQTNIETGSITFVGLALPLNLGNRLSNSPASAIITNIGITLDSQNGLTTSYTFRTSSRKLGLFNKELSDTYKLFNKQRYANALAVANANAQTLVLAGVISDSNTSSALARASMAYWRTQGGLNAGAAAGSSIMDFPTIPANTVLMGNNVSLLNRSEYSNWIMPQSILNPGSITKSQTYVGTVSEDDVYTVCDNNYDKISVMSMDGLFSPVSLYPTYHNSTNYITKYTRSQCPYCRGGQAYTYVYTDLTKLKNATAGSIRSTDSSNISVATAISIAAGACPFCMLDDNKKNDIKKYNIQNLMSPPYILNSGTDYVENRIIEQRDNPLVINKYSLTPIILNSGDFGMSLARQAGDTSTHNIDIVSYGHLPPSGGQSMRALLSADSTWNTNAVDQALKVLDNVQSQTNIRFMGLRGPLVIHGWGYDTNGYPVPNASGEFKKDGAGNIQYHNGTVMYKNQRIINGKLTPPYPEHTFMKDWANTPSSWPVGPVDLRWDGNAGVWVSPQGYKKVWVTIEHDLYNEQPVRGYIESMGEATDLEQLPSGYRKTVYVNNPLGTTKAPRFSVLYCEYSPENGHYIPLSAGTTIATGTIVSSNTATIYANYSYLEDNDSIPYYTASFDNPLSFESIIGKNGIFAYNGENGWILQNIKQE